MKNLFSSLLVLITISGCLQIGRNKTGGEDETPQNQATCNVTGCNDNKICTESGVCVECEVDDDCKENNKVCTDRNVCVECEDDIDCKDSTKVCDVNDKCVPIGGGTTIYYLGDTGPGSGKIFFDKGSFSNGWRYLEVINADSSSKYKFNPESNSGFSTGTIIGEGITNSNNIMTWVNGLSGRSAPATQYCDSLDSGTKTDWFLPSKDELVKIHDNKESLGDIAITNIILWSSSKVGTNNHDVYGVNLHTGAVEESEDRNNSNKVRCIRSF